MQTADMPVWLQRLYSLLFLLLPWSVEVNFGAWNLNIPSEPLLALAGIGVAAAFFRQGLPRPSALTWIGWAWIGWMAVAAMCSGMPIVSWKYWLVEAGHWWVFFFGLWLWPGQWPRLVRLFAWSMLGVVAYAIGHHAYYHFRADQATLAPMPFFADHTVYSAVLVMVLLSSSHQAGGAFLLSFGGERRFGPSRWIALAGKFLQRYAPLLMGGLGGASLLLAGSRAAWLSLLTAGIVGLAVYVRLKWRWWMLTGVLTLGAAVFFREQITASLGKDVSTRERLNRYSCAMRMAADRPWTGFGPGTFQFEYLRYQMPDEMTRISITTPIKKRGPDNYGRGGGAHSEYLQALVELGWPGLAIWLVLAGLVLYTGFRQYRHTGHLDGLLLTLALLTFLLHALLNNFLHDARVAALVWGGVAKLTDTEYGVRNTEQAASRRG